MVLFSCNEIGGALDTVGKAVPGVQIRIGLWNPAMCCGPGEKVRSRCGQRRRWPAICPIPTAAAVFDDGWYRTGDIGYLDADGWLYITDRAKEMIKVRGFQVAPAEIEAVLLGHPAVADCAVFGVPDEASGEAVIAAVARCGRVEADELAALVSSGWPPTNDLSNVVFVPEIPRLPSGKVLRRVLKEQVMSACAENPSLE